MVSIISGASSIGTCATTILRTFPKTCPANTAVDQHFVIVVQHRTTVVSDTSGKEALRRVDARQWSINVSRRKPLTYVYAIVLPRDTAVDLHL